MAEYIGAGDDEGQIVGRSSGKIGFYGITPVARRSSAAMVTLATTFITDASANVAFASITGANALLSQITEIRDTLAALGLHAGS
jgi:hypothetical protein